MVAETFITWIIASLYMLIPILGTIWMGIRNENRKHQRIMREYIHIIARRRIGRR